MFENQSKDYYEKLKLETRIEQLEKEKAELQRLLDNTIVIDEVAMLKKKYAQLKHDKEFQDNLILSLSDDVERLERLMQGLTPDMIRRFKEAIKHKTICYLCKHLGTIGAEKGACKKGICINYGNFEFFNDSEVKK